MLKKVLALLLVAMLAVSLVACGNDDAGKASDIPTKAPSDDIKTTPPVVEETEPVVESEEPSEEPVETDSPAMLSWEITQQYSYVYRDFSDDVVTVSYVAVKNTGSETLFLDTSSFEYKDADGNLLAEYHLMSMLPYFIEPGETGYYYCAGSTLTGDIDENTEYVFNPVIKMEAAKVEQVAYELTNLELTEGDILHDAAITGTVTNSTDVEKSAYIRGILFNDAGVPIGQVSTEAYEFEAGTSREFEAGGYMFESENGPHSFDEVASYLILALPMQGNF